MGGDSTQMSSDLLDRGSKLQTPSPAAFVRVRRKLKLGNATPVSEYECRTTQLLEGFYGDGLRYFEPWSRDEDDS
ncbi:hypothetical protein TNCV_3926821 [Trichonephila clavipes]|nr:hypothetical protein TNCV_3926821 [Trichonephila clavipes]